MRAPDGSAGRYFGLYPAIVTDIVDPSSIGRVQVKFPWLGDDGSDVRAWSTLITPYADDDQGYEMIPSVDTQVMVAFEAGDLMRPYVVGACWNGQESLPESPTSSNDKRLIKSRAKSLLEFDDTEGAAKVTLSMQSGHKVVLDDSAQQVTVVKLLPLASLEPGQYSLKMKVVDKTRNEVLTPTATFTVK